MSFYYAIFKCRLCGETFTDSGTGSKALALRAAINAALQLPTEPQGPGLHGVHSCANGDIGVADFAGFRNGDSEK